MKYYAIVFAVSAGTALIATPLVRRIAIWVKAIDHPSDRKVHPRATPTLGGVGIFTAVLAGMGVAAQMPFFRGMFDVTSEPFGAVVSGAVIVVVGIYDDIRGTSAPAKLAGQILSAGVMVLLGAQLLFFWFPGQGILSLGPDLAVPLTILTVLIMVNAVNLVDGLDGLAAGLVAIAAISFFIYIYDQPGIYGAASPAALLAAIAAGASLGFLPWNFHPAKIFMGDSGSMLLGLLLAAATISGVGRNPYPPVGGDLAVFLVPVLLPLVVLAVPLIDVMLAIARRIKKRRPVTHPDKEHIHHRLMDFGHTHRQAVLLMYLWSALISGSALAVARINGRVTVAGILVASLGIILVTAIPRLWPSRKAAAIIADRALQESEARAGRHRRRPAGATSRSDV